MGSLSNFYKKDLSDFGQILAIELSPFNLSQDVILIGFETKILLGKMKIEDELDLEIIAEYKHPSRCTTIGLSPESSLCILPNIIVFAVGGGDFQIRFFHSNMQGEDTCKVIPAHSSYINDIKFDYDNNYFVSVSDDNTAKVWSAKGDQCSAVFQLTSAGMSACWHREDSSKLLVAERSGLVRFYNVETKSPILSVNYGKTLSSAHWAPSDSQLVATLQMGELLIWNLTKSCVPVSSSLLFTELGGNISFSPSGELVAAVNNLEGSVKVLAVNNQQQRLSIPITLPSNVRWHFRVPVVCVADYKTICFWRVIPK